MLLFDLVAGFTKFLTETNVSVPFCYIGPSTMAAHFLGVTSINSGNGWPQVLYKLYAVINVSKHHVISENGDSPSRVSATLGLFLSAEKCQTVRPV